MAFDAGDGARGFTTGEVDRVGTNAERRAARVAERVEGRCRVVFAAVALAARLGAQLHHAVHVEVGGHDTTLGVYDLAVTIEASRRGRMRRGRRQTVTAAAGFVGVARFGPHRGRHSAVAVAVVAAARDRIVARVVVVVPRAVEERVLALAFEKIRGEKRTLDDLRAGETLADVFAKYGIL